MAELQVAESVPQRWLIGHRIGIWTYALSAQTLLLYSETGGVNLPERHRAGLERFLEFWNNSIDKYLELSTSIQTGIEPLCYLPISTLYLLKTVPFKLSPQNLRDQAGINLDSHYKDLAERILDTGDRARDVLASITGVHKAKGKENETTLGKAQVLAYHITDSVASAYRIARLAEWLFIEHRQFQDLANDKERLRHLQGSLDYLRDPLIQTADKLEAIKNLAHPKLLGITSNWHLVEDILLSRTFCWPLLAHEDIDLPGSSRAVALPISVDILFDGKNKVYLRRCEDRNNLDIHNWLLQIKLALRSAKDLWQSKRRNNYWLRDEVGEYNNDTGASVQLDLSLAEQIIGDYGIVTVKDASATSYLALVILARLLGRQSFLSSAVTGIVAERCQDKEGKEYRDYMLKTPGNVNGKLRYVLGTNYFERFAIGLDEDDETTPALVNKVIETEGSTAEVRFGRTLSTLADIVLAPGWRQYRYVRCPELSWAMHAHYYEGRPGVMAEDDDRVRAVMQSLRGNNTTVLDLGHIPEAIPRAVLSALWHINGIGAAGKFRTSLLLPPPSLSWLFLRMIPEEQDARFWSVVWTAMGAPLGDYLAFQSAPDPSQAANLLASTLNNFNPRHEYRGYRSPDIIVIVGYEHAKHSLDQTKNPLIRNVAIYPLINALVQNGQLRTSQNASELQEWLGNTRIVLLSDRPDIELDPEPQETLANLTMAEREGLKKLAIFRWEFDIEMAALLLGKLEDDLAGTQSGVILSFLEQLRAKGVLRYNAGVYHIPSTLHQYLQTRPCDQNTEQAQLPKLHLAAGVALAPYLLKTPLPSLAFDRSFLPETLSEAEFHLTKAFALCKGLSSVGGQQKERVKNLLGRFQRFSAWPTWYTILGLIRSQDTRNARDAQEMAMQLIHNQSLQFTNQTVHPGLYVNLARLAIIQFKSENRPEQKKMQYEEIAGADGLFEKALRACKAKHLEKEKNYNTLMVMSEYANFLHSVITYDPPSYYEARAVASRLKQLDDDLLKALEFDSSKEDVEAIRGEWFERKGDEMHDHAEAARVYTMGTLPGPAQWAQNWFKAVGAVVLAGHDPKSILQRFEEYVEEFAKNNSPTLGQTGAISTMLDTEHGVRRQQRFGPEEGRLRFEAGVHAIRDKWKLQD